MAFDPKQPRAPKGSPNGGQWTVNGKAVSAHAFRLHHIARVESIAKEVFNALDQKAKIVILARKDHMSGFYKPRDKSINLNPAHLFSLSDKHIAGIIHHEAGHARFDVAHKLGSKEIAERASWLIRNMTKVPSSYAAKYVKHAAVTRSDGGLLKKWFGPSRDFHAVSETMSEAARMRVLGKDVHPKLVEWGVKDSARAAAKLSIKPKKGR